MLVKHLKMQGEELAYNFFYTFCLTDYIVPQCHQDTFFFSYTDVQ